MEKKIFKFKVSNTNVNFPIQFCLGSISNGFGATGSREISLQGNKYNLSVDYDAIQKSEILNIQNYLMVNSNKKWC